MNDTRRQAREWAVQMLVAADLNPPESPAAAISAFWETLATMDEEDGGCARVRARARKFAEERVEGVLATLPELDAALERLLDNWELWRLGTVERAVLRLGAWEMLHGGVPCPVAINEAIDISNWFSSPRSRSIVNGVLDKFAKTLASPKAPATARKGRDGIR